MSAETSQEEQGYVDGENPDARAGWRILDIETADWALSRLADLEQEIAETEKLHAAALLRLKARAALLSARARHGIDFFTSMLREYAETHREELLKGGKRKSRNLLHGSLGWRKTGGGLAVIDPDALLGWASARPPELGLMRVKASPDLPAIKKHFEATGEVPPGMDVKPEVEEFQAKALEVPNGKAH